MINLVFLFICFLFISCGDKNSLTFENIFDSKFDKYVPNPDNMKGWEKEWDKKSWLIVQYTNNKSSQENENNLKNNLLKIFTNKFPELPLLSFINNSLQIQKLSFINNLNKINNSTQNKLGIQISLLKINQYSPLFASPNFNNITEQWKMLSSLDNVLWVEPDLTNELYSYNYPPEKNNNVKPWEIIAKTRTNIAYEFGKNDAGIGYEYKGTNNKNLGSTVVAVIDTGVDYLHPDLSNNIFTNPEEDDDKSNNCKDDDNNGYIDDIYGIDASITPEMWNTLVLKSCKENENKSIQPIPGSADIGGPNKQCPKSISCGHGTHVAGIIAAEHGTEGDAKTLKTIGICPLCKIYSFRTTSTVIQPDGTADNSKISDSSQVTSLSYILNFTDKKGNSYIKIINMSIGKYWASKTIAFLTKSLLDKGIIIIAAAGNDDTESPSFPASYEPVVSVCATNSKEGSPRGYYTKATFSNFGPMVDICAPGVDILSTKPGNITESENGTSQATPVVAGAIAFIKSLHPSYTSEQIINIIKKYANDKYLYDLTISPLNRLYFGKYPDGTEYYSLGTGFLDLGASISLGKICGDNVVDGLCFSKVYNTQKSNLTAQTKDGCIMSSIGKKQINNINFINSTPFLLFIFLLLYNYFKMMKNKK